MFDIQCRVLLINNKTKSISDRKSWLKKQDMSNLLIKIKNNDNNSIIYFVNA